MNAIDLVYGLDDSSIVSMGEYTRGYVSEKFTPECYINDMTTLYRELGMK